MHSKKVVFVGNTNSGKTQARYDLLKQRRTDYTCTIGVEVSPYTGPSGQRYEIWDCAGNPNFYGLTDAYYIRTQVAIIFDGGDGAKSPIDWENEIKQVAKCDVYHVTGVDEVKRLLI